MEKISLRYNDKYIDLSRSLAKLTETGLLNANEFTNHIIDSTIEIDSLEQERKEKILLELIGLEFSNLVQLFGPEYLRSNLSSQELLEKEEYNQMVIQFETIQFKLKKGYEIKNKEQTFATLLKSMSHFYQEKMFEELNNDYIR